MGRKKGSTDIATPDPLEWLPWQWWGILTLMAAGGTLLICVDPSPPTWAAQVSARVKPDAWWRLIGIYLLAVPFSHLAVALPLRGTHRLFKLRSTPGPENLWPPALLGACEAVLYPTALLLGHAEFLAIWLGLKVAGQWSRWGIGDKGDNDAHEGRRRYLQFLIGSALALMCGVATYAAMKVLVVG